jgi:hypothetical protein
MFNHHMKMEGCAKIYTEESGWERLRDAAITKEKPKTLSEQFEQDAGTYDPPKRQGLDEAVTKCNYEKNDDGSWILIIFALPFFVAAYILGGAFFRPPKAK